MKARNDERAFKEWGFTNDPQHVADVRGWVAAAVADGWSIQPTYDTEPVESAATLRRDGYVAMVLMRDKSDAGTRTYRYEAKVSAWGPDGLSIRPTLPYDWTTMTAALRTCNLCHAEDVETFRYSFAGRCCAACIPQARKEYESGNWTA